MNFRMEIQTNENVQIYGKGSKPKSDTTNLEYEKPTWGLGASTQTALIDAAGDEQAFYRTKTVFNAE